jgi:O-antigen chain-terminating methyltransferase
MSDEPGRSLLNRLLAERTEAHRRYNEALTAVDRAIQSLPEWPEPPPPYDEQKLPAINDAWAILGAGVPERPAGLSGAMFDSVWAALEPVFEQQMAFNASLVEHLNRNAAAHREAHAAVARALPALRDSFTALVTFESVLVQFLQQITPLADAHYREIHDAIEQLRTITNVAQRAAISAQRAVASVPHAPDAPQVSGAEGAKAPSLQPRDPEGAKAPSLQAPSLQAPSLQPGYVGFEDRFRGSESDIRARLAAFVPYFQGQSDVLDVGCGRGEFLMLLREHGIAARGLDLNVEMVEVCRAHGLDASHGDARAYLRGLPDASLGGLVAVQVIEHLEPSYLVEFLTLAFDKLRPGARLVLETINPACWVAFFESFLRDLTHQKPIHPETLQFLLQASGFADVEIVYRAPIDEAGKLARVTPRPEHFGDTAPDALTELVSSFNANVDRLNGRLFSFQDYAAIATKA